MADFIPIRSTPNPNLSTVKGQPTLSGPTDVCLNPRGSVNVGQNSDQVATACQDFEAVLVSYLLKTMRQSVPKQDWLDNNGDTDYFRGLMEWEVAVQASRQNRFGLWKSIYRQVTGNAPDSLLANSVNSSNSLKTIENTIGGPSEILGDRITNHPIGGTGSSRTAEQTSEDSGDLDSP